MDSKIISMSHYINKEECMTIEVFRTDRFFWTDIKHNDDKIYHINFYPTSKITFIKDLSNVIYSFFDKSEDEFTTEVEFEASFGKYYVQLTENRVNGHVTYCITDSEEPHDITYSSDKDLYSGLDNIIRYTNVWL